MHNGSVFRRTVRSLTRPSAFLVTLVFGNLFSAILGILVSLVVRDAINAFLYRQHQEEVTAFWLAGVCALLILISTPLSAFVCNTLSKQTSMFFRNTVFRRVTRLPRSTLDAQSPANVLSVATNDAAQLESIFDSGLHWLVSPTVTGGLCLATAIWLNWRLACVQLAVMSLSNLSAGRLKAPLGQAGRALQATLGEVVASYSEILQGVSAIRLYSLHDIMDQRFVLVSDEVLRHRETLAKLNGIIDGMDQFFLGLAYLGVFAAGSWLVLKGAATWGTVAAILGLQAGVGDLGAIGGAWSRLQSQLSGAERVFELLDRDDESDSRVSAASLSANRSVTPRGAVVLRDVRFSYPGGSETVRGVSLTLSPGSIIGLSGPSGCGKSTLAKIILRLYPAQNGSIEVGGRIAYVPQDAFLFDDTILHNILCGRPA
ncbi:MAG: ABC transporter transmembrane domain-containing protein, partial [Sulfobacillus sp.]